MSNWTTIIIAKGNNTPTEKAVICLFCNETYLINGVEYWIRSIDKRALPYTHECIKAARAYKASRNYFYGK